ncbi:unnamed protein product [Amoebophrya sp. A25]|nr:unnamed protein product [Amoebophrya sp. A25]|eukprot:GSA25T00027216001.1
MAPKTHQKGTRNRNLSQYVPAPVRAQPFTRMTPNGKTRAVIQRLGLNTDGAGIVSARNHILKTVRECPTLKLSEVIKRVGNDKKVVGLKINVTKEEEAWKLAGRVDNQCHSVIRGSLDLTVIPIERLLVVVSESLEGKHQYNGPIIYDAMATAVERLREMADKRKDPFAEEKEECFELEAGFAAEGIIQKCHSFAALKKWRYLFLLCMCSLLSL